MDVRYLMLAKYAEQTPDGMNVIGGGIDVFRAESFPHAIPSLYVAVKVTFERSDLELPHTLRVRLIAPDGDQLTSTETIPVPVDDLPPGKENLSANLTFGFHSFLFPKEGRYRIQLLCDEETAKESVFRLERQPSADPPVVPLDQGGNE
jgi:hypothetical protein